MIMTLHIYYENVKHTEKLKEVDGTLLYTCHIDSTIDTLLYLPYHLSIHLAIHPPILHFDTFHSKCYTCF